MALKAIVIGATGVVGRAVVEQLQRANDIGEIIAITRKPVVYTSSKINNVVVDFECLDNDEAIFSGDLFFSCLGTTLKQAGSIANQRRVDVDYQYKAAQLAAKGGISHYCLVSAWNANAQSANAYLAMKGELEVSVAALDFEHVSIFQPSLLLGEREKPRIGEQIAAMIMPCLCWIPGLKRYRPITGEQVAAKMIAVGIKKGKGIERFTLDEIFNT